MKENDSFPRQLTLRYRSNSTSPCSVSNLLDVRFLEVVVFFDEMDFSFRSFYLRLKFNFFLQF